MLDTEYERNVARTAGVRDLSYLGVTNPAGELARVFRDPEMTWATLVLVPWLKSHLGRVEDSVAISSLHTLRRMADAATNDLSASELLADGLKLADRIK